MQNINMKVTGTTLTITVDISKRLGKSKSGKTTLIASSEGNVPVPGTDVVAGINLYTKGE